MQVSAFLSGLAELSHKKGVPLLFLEMVIVLLGGGRCGRQAMSSGMREGGRKRASKETNERLWAFPAGKSIAYEYAM